MAVKPVPVIEESAPSVPCVQEGAAIAAPPVPISIVYTVPILSVAI
jgi:hypothetical protein